MAPPEQMVRVVRDQDGSLNIGRRLAGRGAWLCAASPPEHARPRPACLDLAVRRQAFERALRAPLQPGAAESLRAKVAERARMDGRDT